MRFIAVDRSQELDTHAAGRLRIAASAASAERDRGPDSTLGLNASRRACDFAAGAVRVVSS
jgi:hypothetical protein